MAPETILRLPQKRFFEPCGSISNCCYLRKRLRGQSVIFPVFSARFLSSLANLTACFPCGGSRSTILCAKACRLAVLMRTAAVFIFRTEPESHSSIPRFQFFSFPTHQRSSVVVVFATHFRGTTCSRMRAVNGAETDIPSSC